MDNSFLIPILIVLPIVAMLYFFWVKNHEEITRKREKLMKNAKIIDARVVQVSQNPRRFFGWARSVNIFTMKDENPWNDFKIKAKAMNAKDHHEYFFESWYFQPPGREKVSRLNLSVSFFKTYRPFAKDSIDNYAKIWDTCKVYVNPDNWSEYFIDTKQFINKKK